MTAACRSTIVCHGRHAMRCERLHAARDGHHGTQIMSFEQAAVRLAGGFIKPIDDETLRSTLQSVLPNTPLGELENIKSLPGMVNAAADTLHKVWRAGIDLSARAADHPRLEALAHLEAAVLAELPAGMLRPMDIVACARSRIHHSQKVLGALTVEGLTELSPCWRPLLIELATEIPVTWNAGPRRIPAWLAGSAIKVVEAPAQHPEVSVASAASGLHEAIEALRWVRSLLASGDVAPHEIAIAAASPAEYDDHFLALRSDANIDLHFVHGVRSVTTREGQAAAALADILVRGLSQTRIRRLAALCSDGAALSALPEGWLRVLPTDAPMATSAAWNRLLSGLAAEDWPDGNDHSADLKFAVELLARGADAADEIGPAFLSGRALAIWRKALMAGPAASIDTSLENLKQDDGLDSCVSVTWMPVSALAASPRRFVRLIGLNSSRWPRGISEDRLIPDHIIPTHVLDPLPINQADRRDFETILATTSGQLVLSRARRDSDGRLLGRSPLLAGLGTEMYLRRNAVPLHAFSETDRLMARAEEFRGYPQAVCALACWLDWKREEITAHDGKVRADHPLIQAVLGRTQSASSLRRLLRNPLGFVWVYGLHWSAPDAGAEPLVLDPLEMGDLVHMVLDFALQSIEAAGGLGGATAQVIDELVYNAAARVAADWESERPVPPAIIWTRTLSDARVMASNALTYGNQELAGAQSYAEVPFGGSAPKSDGAIPWDPSRRVEIPGAGFAIKGYIDRLDILDDGKRAIVRDYKTGRAPKSAIRLNGGKELQRCLYGFAVKSLLGEDVSITASLLYPKENLDLQLDDADAVLSEVTGYLVAARSNLQSGLAIPGPDTGDDYDDLAFALPANAGPTYCKRKRPIAAAMLGDAAQVWEAE